MKKKVHIFLINHGTILASFFFPLILMLGIYAFQRVFPFGNETLLTIDLGQQYIDFYADYQENLLSNPSNFIYSFQKSLGGEMIGLWAYYLSSPFNLIFLLFPKDQLSLAVTILTLIKIAAMGLSFSIYIKKVFPGKSWSMITFSTIYAMMGYTIVYQLNLMWLDGLIFLPLIALGLEKMMREKRGWLYSLFLGITLYANYYIGYMICVFLPLFFIFRCIPLSKEENWTFKDLAKQIGLFLSHSLLAAGLVAVLLFPTFYTLMDSKAGYMNPDFPLEWAYPPLEILSKFVLGAFNFDQMPSGLPTVFVGTTALFSFIIYLFHKNFPVSERVYSFSLALFLIVSMNIEALNKIWHAMQYPVWFPYRFAFLFSFFVILNSYRAFSTGIKLTYLHIVLGLVASISISTYLWKNLDTFDYLTLAQIIAAQVIFFLVLLLLAFNRRKYPIWQFLLLALTIGEMTANAAISLSRLGYVDHDQYSYETQAIQYLADEIQAVDDGFYRLEKTFHRSKNDSHQAQYKSVTHFSSTYENSMPELFKHLGFTAHNGFTVYSNGTLLTDALFGLKYYLNEVEFEEPSQDKNDFSEPELMNHPFQAPDNFNWDSVQTKPDLNHYPIVRRFNNIDVHQNPFSLPIGFAVSEDIQSLTLENSHPIDLQNELIHALAGTSGQLDLFLEEEFASIDLHNTSIKGSNLNRTVYKNDLDEEAYIEFAFQPNLQDSYYMTFHPKIKYDDANLTLNDKPFDQYPTYYEPIVLNLAAQSSNRTTRFRIELESNQLDIANMKLYRLNTPLFRQLISSLQVGGLNVTESTSTSLKGQVTNTQGKELLLFTLPYSPGWTVTVDGEKVTPYETLDSLMAIDLPLGTHDIDMHFTPPGLWEGVGISLISFVVLFFLDKKEKEWKNQLN